MKDYVHYNQVRWNHVARKGISYSIPISHEQFLEAKERELSVYLTVGQPVPSDWFDRTTGKKILGLACGGGQQGPQFAAKGYETTIMDFSEEQLQSDRLVAEREGLEIETVLADMTQPFPFPDSTFDIVFCPVSNVYIESLTNLWQEAHRVLKTGGLLMVGYMNPWIYHFDEAAVWDNPDAELVLTHALPYNSRKLEEAGLLTISHEYGYEFSHTLESQIRGQLQAGFAMIDFYESKNPDCRLSQYAADYLANLSVKLE